MQVFDLQSKISLDSSDFFSGLRKSERGMKDFGDKMAMGFDKLKSAAKWLVTGVAVKQGVDAIKTLANETANAGDRIDKQSQALGISRKAFQEWDYILSQSGASIDSLGFSMKTLSSAILDGSNETDEALKTIGLSVDSLKGLTQEQAFERVVRAFQTLPAGMQKSAAAVKLFGRNGRELLPLLNSDIYTIDILRAKAQDLGLVMSDDAVNASVAYTDALDTLQRTFTGFRYSIGSKILPVLTNAFTKITNYAGKIRRAYEAEGLSGVFKTVVADIRNIKWPSWDDVQKAATKAWDDIKKGVADFGGLVFGKNKDGEVNWPSVTDALSYAGKLWGWIVDGVADLGGLIFGRDKDGEVNWPTLKDIIEYADNLWGELVDAVVNFAGLVFGKNKDGEVNWPSFSDLVLFAEGLWADLIAFVGNLGGMVFGKNKDGTVKWPTLKDILEYADGLWGKIVDAVANFAGMVFGKNKDGTVNWPTFFDLVKFAQKLWDDLIVFVADLGGMIFGKNTKGEVNWPTLKDLTDAADALWKEVVEYAGKLGGLIFGDSPEAVTVFQEIAKAIGAISAAVLAYGFYTKLSQTVSLLRSFFTLDISGFSKTGLILAGISAGLMLIYEHWDEIESALQGIGTWITDNVITPITTAINAIEDFLENLLRIRKVSDSIRNITSDEASAIREMVGKYNYIAIRNKIIDTMQMAGYSDSDIAPIEGYLERNNYSDEAIEKVIAYLENIDSHIEQIPESTEDAIEDISDVGEEANAVSGDYPINFPVSVEGDMPEVSSPRANRHVELLDSGSAPIFTGDGSENASFGAGSLGVDAIQFRHAKGLWDVPYNDYPALLHEGEMVLTKTQANEYRDGGGSGASSRMIVSAIQKLENTMANLRLMVGEKEFGRATTEYGGRRMNNYIGGVDDRLAAGYGS